MIKKIFDKQNVNIKDYTYEFCKNNSKNDFFLKYDPVHLSRHGHKFISDLVIAEKIFK